MFQSRIAVNLLELLFGGPVLFGEQNFIDDFVILNLISIHKELQVVTVSVSEEHKVVLSIVALIFFFWVQPWPIVFAPSRSNDKPFFLVDLSNSRIWL